MILLVVLPVCIRMCSSRELLSLQAFSQTVHMKLEVLVWVVMWARRVDFRPKVFSHMRQLKARSPVWVTRWDCRWDLLPKMRSQKSH